MADIYEKCLKNARPIQQKMEENLYNIRILDATIKQIEKELKQKLTQMANTLKKTSKDERRRQYEAIEKLYERAKNLSDDKIRLAESNYEMVDVFIQKLDKETSSFNSYAECVQQSNGRTHSSAGTSKDSTEVKARAEEQQPAVNRRRGTAPASSSTTSSQSLKRGTTGRTNAKETANLVKNEATEPDNIGAKGDMPIDPNEPRYCFCQQVSFGHMVACDNKDCPLEWFHFDCVDLKASPKGKWFCPKCRGDDRDSTRRQQQQTKTPKSGGRGNKDTPGKQ